MCVHHYVLYWRELMFYHPEKQILPYVHFIVYLLLTIVYKLFRFFSLWNRQTYWTDTLYLYRSHHEFVSTMTAFFLVHCIIITVSENCTVCGIFRISAHCLTCLQGLCSECDRLYHSNPERANHCRTAVSSSSKSSSSHRSVSVV